MAVLSFLLDGVFLRGEVMRLLILFLLLSSSVMATDLFGLGSNVDRALYPVKYALAKDSLVAIKDGSSYIVYPKYTFSLPLRFVYKIHPEVCIQMKAKRLGSLKNPFNKNLSLMPKFKEGVKLLKSDAVVGNKVIVFKNLNHLQKTTDSKSYTLWDNKMFITYIRCCNAKYDLESEIDKNINKKVKFRLFKALNRFRYCRVLWFKSLFKRGE